MIEGVPAAGDSVCGRQAPIHRLVADLVQGRPPEAFSQSSRAILGGRLAAVKDTVGVVSHSRKLPFSGVRGLTLSWAAHTGPSLCKHLAF